MNVNLTMNCECDRDHEHELEWPSSDSVGLPTAMVLEIAFEFDMQLLAQNR